MRSSLNRNIPFTTKCSVIFGGFHNQFGWAFIGFSLMVVWMFVMHADLSFTRYSGNLTIVGGIITGSDKTSSSINDIPVYKYLFKFTTVTEEEFENVSFTTGQNGSTGNKVIIEYPEGKPEYARIKGMRSKMFGPLMTLMIMIFPVAGFIMLFSSLRKSLRVLRLLKYGEMVKGKLILKEPTSTDKNERTIYKYTFSFQDKLGREYEVTEKTHVPDIFEDKVEEQLLYFTSRPEDAMLLGSIHLSPSINQAGQIDSTSLLVLIAVLTLPLAMIIGHGYLVIKFFIL